MWRLPKPGQPADVGKQEREKREREIERERGVK